MDNRERSRLIAEEEKRARRLRLMVDLATSTLYQDQSLTLGEARQLVKGVRRASGRLFPGKEGTFDMLLLPRLERILLERWGEGMEERIQ